MNANTKLQTSLTTTSPNKENLNHSSKITTCNIRFLKRESPTLHRESISEICCIYFWRKLSQLDYVKFLTYWNKMTANTRWKVHSSGSDSCAEVSFVSTVWNVLPCEACCCRAAPCCAESSLGREENLLTFNSRLLDMTAAANANTSADSNGRTIYLLFILVA